MMGLSALHVFVLGCLLTKHSKAFTTTTSAGGVRALPVSKQHQELFHPSKRATRFPLRINQGLVRCTHQRPTNRLSGTTTDNEGAEQQSNQKSNPKDKLSTMEYLFFSFRKGLTLPFPALRRAVLYPNRVNKKLSIGLSMKEGFVAIIAYLLMGVIAFHRIFERWSIIDSLYFTCVCFSTVGYGDLCPSNRASQIFTSLFGLGGIIFVGAAVATVGSTVVETEKHVLERAQKTTRKRLLKLFDGMPTALKKFRKHSEAQQLEKIQAAQKKNERKKEKIKKKKPSWRTVAPEVIMSSLPSLSIVIVGGFIMRFLNGVGSNNPSWSFTESIYYALVTASTIGFGDLAPQTPAARLFSVLFLPLAVAAAGELFSAVALQLVQHRQKVVFEQELRKDLNMGHLKAMDTDGDGMITREEYVAFMLMEMGRVDIHELNELHTQFDELDVLQSGYLDREDIKVMAMLRGRTVKE